MNIDQNDKEFEVILFKESGKKKKKKENLVNNIRIVRMV